MSAEGVTLAGAVDAVCGHGISVYQDHDKVRISVGCAEAKLDMQAVAGLMSALRDAAIDARLWELGTANAAAALEDGRGLASCGHPADADGECSCSWWPERAPDRG